jgi:hypothetical protein
MSILSKGIPARDRVILLPLTRQSVPGLLGTEPLVLLDVREAEGSEARIFPNCTLTQLTTVYGTVDFPTAGEKGTTEKRVFTGCTGETGFGGMPVLPVVCHLTWGKKVH